MFPAMHVAFTTAELSPFTTDDVIAQGRSTLVSECSNLALRSGRKLSLAGQPAVEPPSSVFSSQVTFACDAAEANAKRVNHQPFHCEHMMSTQQTFITGLEQPTSFWQSEIDRQELFTKDPYSAAFHYIRSIITARRAFLEQLEAHTISFAMGLGRAFLDFVQFSRSRRCLSQNSSRSTR
jgi:hypothetical protein